jgi:hypothetical protein
MSIPSEPTRPRLNAPKRAQLQIPKPPKAPKLPQRPKVHRAKPPLGPAFSKPQKLSLPKPPARPKAARPISMTDVHRAKDAAMHGYTQKYLDLADIALNGNGRDSGDGKNKSRRRTY